jgi:hypothetical protein
LSVFLAAASPARAQTAQTAAEAQALRTAIDDLKRDFDQRLAALETRLAAVESARAPASTAAAPAEPTTAGTGASVTNAKVFNPDMAVIGIFSARLAGRRLANTASLLSTRCRVHES